MSSPDPASTLAHVTVEMVVTRADGTVENLGVASETPIIEPGAVQRLRSLLTRK